METACSIPVWTLQLVILNFSSKYWNHRCIFEQKVLTFMLSSNFIFNCDLKNFTKFTKKLMCRSLFFNNVAACRCCFANFVKLSRMPILDNTTEWLVLRSAWNCLYWPFIWMCMISKIGNSSDQKWRIIGETSEPDFTSDKSHVLFYLEI